MKRFEPRVLVPIRARRPVVLGAERSAASARRRPQEPVPLTEGRIASAIYSDRVIVGRETIEIRHEATSRYAAC
ncbi:hypothetical protein F2981_19375 (plasmid) [Sinorhizobium meliloti]|nr:hypothetical protein [Sinorhizobium meliloti]